MGTVIIIIVAVLGYSTIAGAWISGLQIAAERYVPGCDRYDDWPKVCGVFWPFAGPAAAVYILAQKYIGSKNNNT